MPHRTDLQADYTDHATVRHVVHQLGSTVDAVRGFRDAVNGKPARAVLTRRLAKLLRELEATQKQVKQLDAEVERAAAVTWAATRRA